MLHELTSVSKHKTRSWSKKLLCSTSLALSLTTAGLAASTLLPQSNLTVKASTVLTGKWGGATWTVNGTTLTLSGGNIGNAPSATGATYTLLQAISQAPYPYSANPYIITSINIANPMSANNLWEAFGGFTALKSITGLNNLSYSGSASSMFQEDTALTSLDLSGFNTSNITTMDQMFLGDGNLSTLNLSNFNTSKVTDMDYMFYQDTVLTSLNLSSFNTSNVTGMNEMFMFDSSLTSLNLSNFTTSKVSSMYQMFYSDPKLASLNLSNFNTASVISTDYMFGSDSALSQLTFGPSTLLNLNMHIPTNSSTELWRNVSAGTVSNPLGSNIWTSTQFMQNYKGGTQAGTYVIWQH